MEDILRAHYLRKMRQESNAQAYAAAEEALYKVLREEHALEVEARRRRVVELSLRQRIFKTLDDPMHSHLAFAITATILVLILLSTLTLCISTLPAFQAQPSLTLEILEIICVIVFTIEFLGRFLTCDNKIKFMKGGMNIIDFIAVAPFYIELIIQSGNSSFAIIRVVRLTRVFRLFKLGKYSSGFAVISQSMLKSADALALLSFLFAIAVVFFSSLLFYAEQTNAQFVWMPQYSNETKLWLRDGETKPSPFQSIPATFWFSIVAMTTCGYGDAVPKSILGKLVAALAMVLGVIIVAFPISIIAANFALEWDLSKQAQTEMKEKRFVLKTTNLSNVIYLVSKENMQLLQLLGQVDELVDRVQHKQSRIAVILRSLLSELRDIPPLNMVAPDWESIRATAQEEEEGMMKELTEMFEALDENKDGMVPISEMAARLATILYKHLNLQMTEEELDAFVLRLDLDHDGMCDFEEFLLGVRRILEDHHDELSESHVNLDGGMFAKPAVLSAAVTGGDEEEPAVVSFHELTSSENDAFSAPPPGKAKDADLGGSRSTRSTTRRRHRVRRRRSAKTDGAYSYSEKQNT